MKVKLSTTATSTWSLMPSITESLSSFKLWTSVWWPAITALKCKKKYKHMYTLKHIHIHVLNMDTNIYSYIYIYIHIRNKFLKQQISHCWWKKRWRIRNSCIFTKQPACCRGQQNICLVQEQTTLIWLLWSKDFGFLKHQSDTLPGNLHHITCLGLGHCWIRRIRGTVPFKKVWLSIKNFSR